MMSNQFGDIHPAMSEVSEGAPSGQPNKTTWPTVIGIIGIILASLNILGSICLVAFASNLFAGLLSENELANLPSTASPSTSIVTSIVDFVISIWLLFGSIRLIQRHGSSRGILSTWAIVAIIWTLASTAWVMIELNQVSEQADEVAPVVDPSMSESDLEQQEMLDSFNETSEQVGLVCGGIFSLAWPIIVLCFVNGQRRKQEMAAWSNTDDRQQFSI